MTRPSAPAAREDAGVTLIELTVTLSILTTIVAMITTALIMGFRTMTDNANRLDATAQSKTAVESMSRSLRTAIMPSQLKGTCAECDNALFITGDATSVSFYANVDNDVVAPPTGMSSAGPSKVQYTLAGGVLTEKITRPKPHSATDYVYNWCDGGQTGCPVRSRVIARDVAQGGAALFTYYDAQSAQLPVPLQVDETRLRAVDRIDIQLKVDTSQRSGTATTATTVTLPNAITDTEEDD